ncbi:MAG: ABC transporter permease, partial [Zetaproteobacteria bacterium]
APSASHPLGCDPLGRDILARLGAGVRLSVLVASIVVVATACIGTAVGIAAGWFGGWWEMLLMRVVDVVLAFPGLLLAIALAAAFGAGVDKLVVALVCVGWTGFARLARVQVRSLKTQAFVQAELALGAGLWRTARTALMPNIAAPLLVEASFAFAGAIVGEAGLSFLGVGAQPPTPSLGVMIREGASYMLSAPMLGVWPGVVLAGLVLASNLAGDALRDRLDVRTQR